MNAIHNFWLLFILITYSASAEFNPLSDEFIELINNKQTAWKAGRNFDPSTTPESLKQLTGLLPKVEGLTMKLPRKYHVENDVQIPAMFDAREQWKQCADIIGNIMDQSKCGGCWAFGAAEAMSDRICIFTNATTKVNISVQDLLTCCIGCGFACNGGWMENAWNYWYRTGIVTGGGYGSGEGCKSFTVPPCSNKENSTYPPCNETIIGTLECEEKCDKNYPISYENDKYIALDYAYEIQGEKQIQLEIMKNGPVEAGFRVYQDFYNYKSGVYFNVFRGEYTLHAVKIIGWGNQFGLPYWLIANSWNTDWGENGYFKMLRGVDNCGIESSVVAGIPNV